MFPTKKPGKRSPLKEKPPRAPGDSLSEEIGEVEMDGITAPILAAGMFAGVAAVEWCHVLLKFPPQPWAFTLFAIGGCAYAWKDVKKARAKLRNLRLGRDGEKTVGSHLDDLRSLGYQIYHDIPGNGEGEANIDHLVVGPKGIFVVETKTRSKPIGRDPEIIIMPDNKLLLAGQQDMDNSIGQTCALRTRIRDLLNKKPGGRTFRVRGILTFPGWCVKNKPQDPDLWVLNPKSIKAFIMNDRSTDLSQEELDWINGRLAEYIQTLQG